MKKKYDQKFKLEVATLVVKENKAVSAVANELGIHLNTLNKWICQIRV